MINPSYGEDYCAPDSTIEEDAIRGKWVRVPRNLNREGNYISGWLVSPLAASEYLRYQPYTARRNYTTAGQDARTLI